MHPNESTHLDLLRAAAAIAVLLNHAPLPYDDAPRHGHVAVVVFFVLSGYIISAISAKRSTFQEFAVARLARLWSVLVPALLLTAACDTIGRRYGLHPEVYASVPADMPILRLGAMLGFLSQTWVSIQPLSDFAAWSLCLEFWYYMTFAAILFVPKGRWRNPVITAAAFMSGPMGLALMPLWFLGVLAQQRPVRAIWLGWLLFFGGIAGFIAASSYYGDAQRAAQATFPPWLYLHLDQARVFFLDWLAGAFVAANLVGGHAVAHQLRLHAIAGPIRWCAGLSFAAYLFHEPLFLFWSAFLPTGHGWIAVALSVVVIIVLGTPAERSKTWWRQWMLAITTPRPHPNSV